MVKQYKDYARKVIQDKPRVSVNLPAPDNRIGNEGQVAIQNFLNTIRKDYVNRAITKADRIGTERGENNANITFKDGTPQLQPYEAGGTYFQNAYQKAAKATYKNELSTAIDTKLIEALDEWGAKGNNTDIEGLQQTFKLKFDPMLENVNPEFQGYARRTIQTKTAAQLKTYITQRVNKDTKDKFSALLDDLNAIGDEADFGGVLPDTPEAEDLLRQHEENFKARATFNLSLDVEAYDLEKARLLKIFGVNDFFTKINKVVDGKYVTTNKQIDEIIQALSSSEDRDITLGGEKVSSKIFKELQLNANDRSAIQVDLRNFKQIRNAAFTEQITEGLQKISDKFNTSNQKIEQLLLKNDYEGAKKEYETHKSTAFLNVFDIGTYRYNELVRTHNQKSDDILAKITSEENKFLADKELETYQNKYAVIKNNLSTYTSDELLLNLEELEDVKSTPAISTLVDNLKVNPSNWEKAQKILIDIDSQPLQSQNIDVLDAAINALKGVGNSNETTNLFGRTVQELQEQAGIFDDIIVERLEAKKKEISTGTGSSTAGEKALNRILSGGVVVDGDLTSATNYLLNQVKDADLKDPDHNVLNQIMGLYHLSGTSITKDSKLNKVILKYLDNFDVDGIYNFGLPAYLSAEQSNAGFEGGLKTKGLLSALQNFTKADLQALKENVDKIKAKSPLTNVYDAVAQTVLDTLEINPTDSMKKNPTASKAAESFFKNQDIKKIIMEEAEKVGKNFEYNTTARAFSDEMFYTAVIDVLANDTIDADSIKQTIKQRARDYFRSFSDFTFSIGSSKPNKDVLMSSNTASTKNIKEAQKKYGKLLKDFDIDEDDISSNTFRNSYYLVEQVKNAIADNTIDVTQITDGNLKEEIPNWMYSLSKGLGTFSGDQVILPEGANMQPTLFQYGSEIIKRIFNSDDDDYKIDAINGDTVLNMTQGVDLKEHFSYKKIPLIPGSTLKFKLNQDTKKYEVFTNFAGTNQPLIDTTTGNILTIDAPPNETFALTQKLNIESRDDEFDRVSNLNFNFGDLPAPVATMYDDSWDKKEEKKVPSLANKANFNKKEAFVTNVKRQLLLNNAVTPESYNTSIKSSYVVPANNNEFAVIPSQILQYVNGVPTVVTLSIKEAQLYAETKQKNIPTYKTEQEAKNRRDVIDQTVKEDANDLLEGGTADPVPELMNITAKGQTVVDNTIDVINRVLPMGKWEIAMMKGIAITESENGTNKRTFLPNRGSIGIWQLDKGTAKKSMFQDLKRRFKEYQANNSKHNLFGRNVDKITEALKKEGYDFNLATMTYRQLQQPINSGAVVRLFLTLYKTSDYNSLAKAGPFWKKNYNTPDGKGKKEDFLDKAAKYYEGL